MSGTCVIDIINYCRPQPMLLEQVGKMEAAGLLARLAGADGTGAVAYMPTP